MKLLKNWFLVGVLGFSAAACYSLQPTIGVEPQPGTQVAFDVNEAGRSALGGTMGPEIARVEGRLIEKDNGAYLLSVSNVKLLRGGEQVWSGEQVRLNKEYLGPSYEKRFSWGRTLMLAGAGLGAVGAIVVTRSLLVGGGDDEGPPPCQVEPCIPDERRGRLIRP